MYDTKTEFRKNITQRVNEHLVRFVLQENSNHRVIEHNPNSENQRGNLIRENEYEREDEFTPDYD